MLGQVCRKQPGALEAEALSQPPSGPQIARLGVQHHKPRCFFTETGDHDQADGERGAPQGLDACSFLTQPFPAAQTACTQPAAKLGPVQRTHWSQVRQWPR